MKPPNHGPVLCVACLTVLAAGIAAIAGGDGKSLGKIYEIGPLKMKLIRLEPGEFLMGSPDDETDRQPNEFRHKVRFAKAFYLQQAPVTQAQYKGVMGENPSQFHGDELPVENVSWDDAVKFCAELSKREKRPFRLPTEAEWEYAARAGKAGPVAGNGKLDDIAWYGDNSGRDRLNTARLWDESPNDYFGRLSDNGCGTHRVATKGANDWGFFDMQGNVEQWVADWMSDDYYRDPAAANDPQGPVNSPLGSRVMRGASWGSDPRNCRVAHRDWNTPGTRTPNLGFRVAMAVDE